jgi:serine/threonine protein kinase
VPHAQQKYETIEERGSGNAVVRRYLKGKLLGKGGFAKCYWATCLQTQKQYAMKVVLKSTLQKPKAKAKLQAEVKIHSMLRHQHVVYFSHFFEDANCYYMLLELCHNKSFSELMKRRKRLTEPEVQYYMSQILAALAYLHSINVIHRDLKLGNLLLDKNMCVKIGDLGLAAKVTDSEERKRTLCGTPNYIAPEILENKHGHSFQVDIWSTGVVMYTLLVGRPPYESRDVKSTYKRILANNFTFPEHVPVSEAARDLICRMLQTNPEKRPSIAAINAHSFFTRPDAHIPTSMPTSALVSPPVFGRALAHSIAAVPASMPPSSAAPQAASAPSLARPSVALRDVPAVPHQPAAAKTSSSRSAASANAAAGRAVAARRTSDNVLKSGTDPRQKEVVKMDHNEHAPVPKSASETPQIDTVAAAAGEDNVVQRVVGAARSDVQSSRNRRSTKSGESGSVKTNPLLPGAASPAEIAQLDKANNKADIPRPSTADSRRTSGRGDSGTGDAASASAGNALGGSQSNSRPVTADATVGGRSTSADLKGKHGGSSAAIRRRSGSLGGASSGKVSPAAAEMGTLECIHHNLQQTMQTIEVVAKGGSAAAANLVEPTLARSSSGTLSHCSPSLWVTQYVDYTSKYGLGYLFVDGSTGVYFNDSTKIILAAHGEHFQYMERVRSSEKGSSSKEKTGMRPAERSEHHTLSDYPPSLHKKVTLLQHFRDYLVSGWAWFCVGRLWARFPGS